MENFQYTQNGITVDIQIGESDHKFSHIKNGVKYEYGIKGFRTNYKAKAVIVDYSLVATDSDGKILFSEAPSYTESTPLRYQALYAMNSFSEAAGDFYGKQCINGVMERTVGFKAFDNAGQLLEVAE